MINNYISRMRNPLIVASIIGCMSAWFHWVDSDYQTKKAEWLQYIDSKKQTIQGTVLEEDFIDAANKAQYDLLVDTPEGKKIVRFSTWDYLLGGSRPGLTVSEEKIDDLEMLIQEGDTVELVVFPDGDQSYVGLDGKLTD